MAVKNKNVNLYAGMGIYMWKDTAGEAVKQLNITSGLANVLGTSIYSYGEINEAYQKIDTNLTVQMSRVKNKVWKNLTILPEIAGIDPVKLGSVNNFQASNNILSWDKLDGAKFYIIYRSNDCITYNNDEIVDIISSPNDIVISAAACNSFAEEKRSSLYGGTFTINIWSVPHVDYEDTVFTPNFVYDLIQSCWTVSKPEQIRQSYNIWNKYIEFRKYYLQEQSKRNFKLDRSLFVSAYAVNRKDYKKNASIYDECLLDGRDEFKWGDMIV